MSTAAQLRLLSDLKAVQQSPPEGVSASPLSDDNVSGLLCCQLQCRRRRLDAIQRQAHSSSATAAANRPEVQAPQLALFCRVQLFVWGATVLGPPDTPW